jgi:hypothetical protein
MSLERRSTQRSTLRKRIAQVNEDVGAGVRAAASLETPALKRAVREFAASLKATDAPVERTLALLIDCIADSRLTTSERERLALMRESIIRWAIDAYYAGEG